MWNTRTSRELYFVKTYFSLVMNINSIHVAITIGILFLMVQVISSKMSGPLPGCIFGVKSVSFFLYTSNQRYGKEVRMEDTSVPLHPGRPIVFLVHGFTSEANNSNNYELANTWLSKGDVNIFSLDWSDAACSDGLSLTDLLSYESAVHNVPTVGEYLAKFTGKLVREYGAKVNEIVVVGHSLGAHVAGFAGKHVQTSLGQKYRQIIGLDPASPSFKNRDCADRLCNSDAYFVQAFHTSELGIHHPIGHIDFYFNGGKVQPGCNQIVPSCSHSRSVKYLTSLIKNPTCFIGTQWTVDSNNILNSKTCNPKTCSRPGLNAPAEAGRGTFYVTTTKKEPFCAS